MNIISKVKKYINVLLSFPSTVYFNFHYLPYSQAIRLPILLYKAKLLSCKGSITIESECPVYRGMIKLGFYNVSLYQDSGIVYENNGGDIVFNGCCDIGNNSAISIGKRAKVNFGDNFLASSSLKLVCYYSIVFGECSRIGWDSLIMDTDFHSLTKMNGNHTKGYGPIVIGRNNWFGNGCRIMKNTRTNDYCTFATGSILNRAYDFPSHSLIALSALMEVKVNGIYRDIFDDTIKYDEA